MAKHEKLVTEIERIVKDKATVYRLDLTPSEVYFIRYILDYQTRGFADGGWDDSIRFKRLKQFWPAGECGGSALNPYNAEKMF